MHYLLPEWHHQEAIILAWPDAQTDWHPWLESVRSTYIELIDAISDNNCLTVLLIRKNEISSAKALIGTANKVLFVEADYNDTWVRDYGFLTCANDDGSLNPVEFEFNGWGNKFSADKDNQINRNCFKALCRHPLQRHALVCEGGALEIDGEKRLLSTKFCLSNPARNGLMQMDAYETFFSTSLGAKQTIILNEGHLEGDDTDGHIDTLVRFTPNKGLVIQSCFNRPKDSHFVGLTALVAECSEILPEHQLYELPLPFIKNAEGERLPASYANFLINNGQILAPIYQQPEDKLALEVLSQAYPDYSIVPINALPLVQQFGSIHCITMQVPLGTFKKGIVELAQQGPYVLAGEQHD